MRSEQDSAGLATPVDALFTGSIGELANNGAPSAIDKRTVAEARWLDADGVAGDAVGDPKNHGGPDRALHQYPADHYARWQALYPDLAPRFAPGVLGENISTRGITEIDVCVGDIFTLGAAVLQLAQPRQPCWKIGTRIGIKDLARVVMAEGRAGWHYRVRRPGYIRAGDTLERVERAPNGITLDRMWSLVAMRAPDAEARAQMHSLADNDDLAAEWRQRMARIASQR